MTRKRKSKDATSQIFLALAHPIRRRVLEYVGTHGAASPSEMAALFNTDLGVVSYHVRRLHSSGLLKLTRKVPRRGAVEHYYDIASSDVREALEQAGVLQGVAA